MKILVLEDNATLCNFIKDSLNKEGYIVDTFNDGEEALKCIK